MPDVFEVSQAIRLALKIAHKPHNICIFGVER